MGAWYIATAAAALTLATSNEEGTNEDSILNLVTGPRGVCRRRCVLQDTGP
jgi:hypothetical protein